MKTVEQRLKDLLGEQVFLIANLMAQLEAAQETISKLTKQEQEKS